MNAFKHTLDVSPVGMMARGKFKPRDFARGALGPGILESGKALVPKRPSPRGAATPPPRADRALFRGLV